MARSVPRRERPHLLSIKLLLVLFAASHLAVICRAASSRQAVYLSQQESKLENREDDLSAGSQAARVGGVEGVFLRRSTMTYTDEKIAALKKATEKSIDYSPEKVAYRMGLNASQYHWNCSWRGDPWKIKGGKLGLIFVYTRVQTPIRRGVLRTAYSQYNQDFDVVFAVGFPDPVSYIVERTCQEQEVEGDLILVNCKETHNDGKMYHTIIHLAELLNNMWKRGYKQIIKLDDDSYAHLPNMATYLTEQKGQELAANKYAMWGPRLDHYYFGSLNGFSIDLFLEVVPKIEPKYIGGHFEDWLLGFYMRIFGPREIFDIAMNNSLWTHFPNEQRNVTFMAEDLRQRPMVCFFHCKAIEDWQLLISVVKEAKENSSKTSRKIMWKRLSL